jgi:hypothetical protein
MARVQNFMTEQSFIEEKSDVKALAKIKKEITKEIQAMENDDGKLLNGQVSDGSDPYRELRSASIQVVVKYRDQFEGRIIRRTPESKDFEGQTISGIPPYQTSEIWVHLHEREKLAIEAQIRAMTSRQVSTAIPSLLR